MDNNQPDELAGFLGKFVVGYFLGPKMAAALASVGITVDPALASIALGGFIHKLHVMIAARFKPKT